MCSWEKVRGAGRGLRRARVGVQALIGARVTPGAASGRAGEVAARAPKVAIWEAPGLQVQGVGHEGNGRRQRGVAIGQANARALVAGVWSPAGDAAKGLRDCVQRQPRR